MDDFSKILRKHECGPSGENANHIKFRLPVLDWQALRLVSDFVYLLKPFAKSFHMSLGYSPCNTGNISLAEDHINLFWAGH